MFLKLYIFGTFSHVLSSKNSISNASVTQLTWHKTHSVRGTLVQLLAAAAAAAMFCKMCLIGLTDEQNKQIPFPYHLMFKKWVPVHLPPPLGFSSAIHIPTGVEYEEVPCSTSEGCGNNVVLIWEISTPRSIFGALAKQMPTDYVRYSVINVSWLWSKEGINP